MVVAEILCEIRVICVVCVEVGADVKGLENSLVQQKAILTHHLLRLFFTSLAICFLLFKNAYSIAHTKLAFSFCKIS